MNEDYTEMDPKSKVDPETLASLIFATLTGDISPEELAERAKNVPEHVAKALKNNQDSVKLFMEQQIPIATKYLQDYMKVFAGKEEANKITEKDVVFTYIPKGFDDPYKIPSYKQQKYQIPAETDENVRKMKLQQLGKNPNAKEYSLHNACFKIGYSLTGAK